MRRAKLMFLVTVLGSGLLLASGCALDSWWPVLAGAAVGTFLGQAT